jgi:hypothetical protein
MLKIHIEFTNDLGSHGTHVTTYTVSGRPIGSQSDLEWTADAFRHALLAFGYRQYDVKEVLGGYE